MAYKLPNVRYVCSQQLNSTILNITCQFVAFSINQGIITTCITTIYAYTNYQTCIFLWSDLADIISTHFHNWCIMGDFNAI